MAKRLKGPRRCVMVWLRVSLVWHVAEVSSVRQSGARMFVHHKVWVSLGLSVRLYEHTVRAIQAAEAAVKVSPCKVDLINIFYPLSEWRLSASSLSFYLSACSSWAETCGWGKFPLHDITKGMPLLKRDWRHPQLYLGSTFFWQTC